MTKVAVIAVAFGMAASAATAQDNARVHTETSFDVTVRAPINEAAPLFTPEGERPWAGKHWDPQYVYASGTQRDGLGAVFTIQHGPVQAIWVVTLRDLDARHLQYVYSMPGLLVTTIDVRFEAASASGTIAHVSYARTAVSPEGDEHVLTLTEHDKTASAEWQKSIDAYLQSRAKK
jgi:hypothetical protein